VVPSGTVETPTERIAVEVAGTFDSLAAVADTAVAAGGRTIRLGDIATITRGYEDPPRFQVRFDGTPAIGLAVRMRPGANGLALGAELDAATDEVLQTMPLGIDIHQATDQAAVIDEAVGEFLLKFVIAVAVVLFISFLALGFSAGIIVALSVPLTLAIAAALIIESAGHRFALPQASVIELVRVGGASAARIEYVYAAPVLRLRDRLLPLLDLGATLGLAPTVTEEQEKG